MRSAPRMPLAGWAILALAAFQSRELLSAWRHSPFDRGGWIALFIWAAPAVWLYATDRAAGHGRIAVIGTCLAGIALGAVSGLNALCYIGLAFGIAAMPGLSAVAAFWIATSIGWMPVFSWAANSLPVAVVLALRVTLTLAGSAAMVLVHRKPLITT